jgi:hypothetical protein
VVGATATAIAPGNNTTPLKQTATKRLKGADGWGGIGWDFGGNLRFKSSLFFSNPTHKTKTGTANKYEARY